MSQLTIYLDDVSMRKVKTSAQKAKMSVSRWARTKLTEASTHEWPADYFRLFGSLSEEDLKRPNQGQFIDDLSRRKL